MAALFTTCLSERGENWDRGGERGVLGNEILRKEEKREKGALGEGFRGVGSCGRWDDGGGRCFCVGVLWWWRRGVWMGLRLWGLRIVLMGWGDVPNIAMGGKEKDLVLLTG